MLEWILVDRFGPNCAKDFPCAVFPELVVNKLPQDRRRTGGWMSLPTPPPGGATVVPVGAVKPPPD